MFKIVQSLSFTRYIENTLDIDEEVCARWTICAKNRDITYLDGTPLIITPKLVEDNWGDCSVMIKNHYGTCLLYDVLHDMAEEDFDMELWSHHYDSSEDGSDEWNEEEWTVEKD